MRKASPPIWIAQVDLDRSPEPRPVSRERRRIDATARILVRLHGQVLGFVSVDLTGGADLGADVVLEAIRTQLAGPLATHLAVDGRGGLADVQGRHGLSARRECQYRGGAVRREPISVVVCTRERDDSLASCLKLLQQLDYHPFEVVVVDNAPSTTAARDCFARMVGDDVRFRYVRELEPGLSRARNRGLAEAGFRHVAFTDDDVQVDPGWLDGLAAGFARGPEVGCVTGLVPAARLDVEAQQYFERRFSWCARLEPHVYSLADRRGLSSLYPYSPGLFGTGANFAVDRELLRRLGGFDEALGAGSPAGGGEELDVFVRILRAGRSLAYEPSAVVWHFHRTSSAALRNQLFRYGSGLTAFLSKYTRHGDTAWEIVARLPAGAHQLWRMWSPAAIGRRPPAGLVLVELAGMAAGPLAYARGRRPRRMTITT